MQMNLRSSDEIHQLDTYISIIYNTGGIGSAKMDDTSSDGKGRA